MARPGGYSSDEDFEDDFFFDFGDKPKKKTVQPAIEVTLTPDERLLAAARSSDPMGMRQALEDGANVHCVTPGQEKWTPIMWAAYNGDIELIKILLAAKANPNDAFELRSVLMGLCESPSRDEENLLVCFELLVNSGADFNARDWINTTPLMFACWRNHDKLVRKLLELGADLHASNADGWTPLFFAIDGGHLNIVTLLKERGANLEAVDKLRQTLEEFALNKGLKEIADLVSTEDQTDDYDEQAHEALKRLDQLDYILSECPDISKDRLYGFRSEVVRLLYAPSLRMLLPKFIERDVQLGNLLVWDESQWENSETTQLSFHRKKFPAMARKFHAQPWGKASVRIVTPQEELTVKDIAQIMCNTLRQLHVLSLSTLYCRKFESRNIQEATLKKCLTQSSKIRKELSQIRAQIRGMCDSVETADYIPPETKKRVLPTSFMWLVCLFGMAITARQLHLKLVR